MREDWTNPTKNGSQNRVKSDGQKTLGAPTQEAAKPDTRPGVSKKQHPPTKVRRTTTFGKNLGRWGRGKTLKVFKSTILEQKLVDESSNFLAKGEGNGKNRPTFG